MLHGSESHEGIIAELDNQRVALCTQLCARHRIDDVFVSFLSACLLLALSATISPFIKPVPERQERKIIRRVGLVLAYTVVSARHY
jgi:hypothetical protein